MPCPRDLPKAPEGWFWHASSKVTVPSYLSTPQITLEGPVNKQNMTNRSIGAPKVQAEHGGGVIYSCTLKKLSACCGAGHAVHFLYPSKPELDKMDLMLQAIEQQNCVSDRVLSLLTLVERNAWAAPAIEAMKARGWERAFSFRNQVWHQEDPKNNVQLWWKDCTELYKQMQAEDKLTETAGLKQLFKP